MKRREWDAVCVRCGRCCYEKIDVRGTIYYTQVPCEYLDLNTRLCRVYADRVARRPGCVPLTPELLARGFLPADCPYVADRTDYPAPLLDDDESDESC